MIKVSGSFCIASAATSSGFAACFESKMKLFAGIDDLFDDFAQLVDLDRKNAAIMILIAELRDCALKCAINCFNPVPEQILEPNQQRKTEVSGTRFVDDFQQIDGTTIILQRPRFDVA